MSKRYRIKIGDMVKVFKYSIWTAKDGYEKEDQLGIVISIRQKNDFIFDVLDDVYKIQFIKKNNEIHEFYKYEFQFIQ